MGPFLIFLLLSISQIQLATFGASQEDPNSIIRNTINRAAGIDLIPKDTKFELKKLNGISSHECKDFPGGGRGCVSGSAYSSSGGPSFASAGSDQKPVPILLFLPISVLFIVKVIN